MSLAIRARALAITAPTAGVFVAFGASVEDPWTSTPSGAQGGIRALLCARYGWTDTARGTSGADATRSAIGGTQLQAGGAIGPSGISSYAARCTAYSPVAILWGYGGNDMRASTEPGVATPITPTVFRANLRTVLGAFVALATKPLIILPGLRSLNGAVAALPSYATNQADLEWQYTNVLREEAANFPNVLYVAMRDMPAALFEADTIHPLATTGHQWMADRIAAAMGGF
jgi:hypothetical protein